MNFTSFVVTFRMFSHHLFFSVALFQCTIIPTSQRQPSPLYPGGSRNRYRPIQKFLAAETIWLWTQRLVFFPHSFKTTIIHYCLIEMLCSGFLLLRMNLKTESSIWWLIIRISRTSWYIQLKGCQMHLWVIMKFRSNPCQRFRLCTKQQTVIFTSIQHHSEQRSNSACHL